MLSKNYLLLTCLILIHFLQTSSYAKQQQQNPSCDVSACGNIHNISYPFRLKDDPENCGNSSYEISCENNSASIYIDSYRYHVQAIDYQNYTIRLADPAIENDDTCSFPRYSPNWDNFSLSNYSYSIERYSKFEIPKIAWPVTFLSCPFPVNDSIFTETDHCVKRNYGFNASNRIRHTYIKVGDLNSSDVRDMCRYDVVVMTSFPFKDENNISLWEIHEALLYGFELSWYGVFCGGKCRYCYFDGNGATCDGKVNWFYPLVVFLSFVFRVLPSLGCYSFVKVFGQLFTNIDLIYCDTLRYSLFRVLPSLGCYSFVKVFGQLFTNIDLIYCDTLRYSWILGILEFAIEVSLAWRILIGMPIMFCLLICKLRRRHLSVFDLIEDFLQSHNNLMPIRYSYSDIKKMTRGFREKLGQGGYGSVYRGKLRSGSIVAIKVLNKSSGNGQDFINEVATIGRIHHINVVKLVGYCAERSKCALVYDFMPNGSLEKYIFSNQERDHNLLSWERKYEIAVGVARGIEYLHRGCDIQILHFDIKPHNILLDENFIPKISDFGLAKFYSTEKNTVTLTAARGTIGYVAPELINRSIGGVSYKADVYSFGMLLMEMVGQNRDLAANDQTSSQYFPDWIYDRFNKGKDIEMGNIGESDDDSTRKITRRMTIVALWCIQLNPCYRPSMSKVLEMLESETELLQIPPQHFQSPRVAGNDDQTWGTDSTDSIALLHDDAFRDQ